MFVVDASNTARFSEAKREILGEAHDPKISPARTDAHTLHACTRVDDGPGDCPAAAHNAAFPAWAAWQRLCSRAKT